MTGSLVQCRLLERLSLAHNNPKHSTPPHWGGFGGLNVYIAYMECLGMSRTSQNIEHVFIWSSEDFASTGARLAR